MGHTSFNLNGLPTEIVGQIAEYCGALAINQLLCTGNKKLEYSLFHERGVTRWRYTERRIGHVSDFLPSYLNKFRGLKEVTINFGDPAYLSALTRQWLLHLPKTITEVDFNSLDGVSCWIEPEGDDTDHDSDSEDRIIFGSISSVFPSLEVIRLPLSSEAWEHEGSSDVYSFNDFPATLRVLTGWYPSFPDVPSSIEEIRIGLLEETIEVDLFSSLENLRILELTGVNYISNECLAALPRQIEALILPEIGFTNDEMSIIHLPRQLRSLQVLCCSVAQFLQWQSGDKDRSELRLEKLHGLRIDDLGNQTIHFPTTLKCLGVSLRGEDSEVMAHFFNNCLPIGLEKLNLNFSNMPSSLVQHVPRGVKSLEFEHPLSSPIEPSHLPPNLTKLIVNQPDPEDMKSWIDKLPPSLTRFSQTGPTIKLYSKFVNPATSSYQWYSLSEVIETDQIDILKRFRIPQTIKDSNGDASELFLAALRSPRPPVYQQYLHDHFFECTNECAQKLAREAVQLGNTDFLLVVLIGQHRRVVSAAVTETIIQGKFDMLQQILFNQELSDELITMSYNSDDEDENDENDALEEVESDMHFAHVAIKRGHLFVLPMLTFLEIPIPQPKVQWIMDAALSKHGDLLNLKILYFLGTQGVDLERVLTHRTNGKISSRLCQVLCDIHNSVEVLEEYPYIMNYVNQILHTLLKSEPTTDKRTEKARRTLFKFCLDKKFSEFLNPEYFKDVVEGDQHMLSVLKSIKS